MFIEILSSLHLKLCFSCPSLCVPLLSSVGLILISFASNSISGPQVETPACAVRKHKEGVNVQATPCTPPPHFVPPFISQSYSFV